MPVNNAITGYVVLLLEKHTRHWSFQLEVNAAFVKSYECCYVIQKQYQQQKERVLQWSKSCVSNLLNKINGNEVQGKLCWTKLAYHKWMTAMSFESEAPGRKGD